MLGAELADDSVSSWAVRSMRYAPQALKVSSSTLGAASAAGLHTTRSTCAAGRRSWTPCGAAMRCVAQRVATYVQSLGIESVAAFFFGVVIQAMVRRTSRVCSRSIR